MTFISALWGLERWELFFPPCPSRKNRESQEAVAIVSHRITRLEEEHSCRLILAR